MATTEKQGAMVLHEEGVTAPTLAPPAATPPSIFVVLKQLQSGDSGKDKGSLMAISEANKIVNSAATSIHPTSSTLADANNTSQLENLPADARCKGITVTLDNNNMWNEFYRCQTEMTLTKPGRRMFPYCRFRLSGMEPFQNYLLAMDIVPVDNFRYRWSGKGWEPNGKAEPHISRLFVHPESPATGLHWMQYPVSFYRLKLCNTLDQEEHIILHSMHRYRPRLHIIPEDKATENIQVDTPDVVTLSFSQTEFFAVTSYQNLRITQLKIDYNPFAKGFREDAVNARSTKAKNGMSAEEAESELKLSKEMTTLNNLKTLFMKRNAAVKVNKDQNLPSPTNGEKKAVNGDASTVETNVPSLCSKKRPSSAAFSDFIKGAHVKVKKLSLEKIKKNAVVLQTSTVCTNEQNEVMDISSKTENILQVVNKDGTLLGDIHKCKNPQNTSTKTCLLEIDETKAEVGEHKAVKNTLVSNEKQLSHLGEKGTETLLTLVTDAKPKENTKKASPHKRPERVPLPLLAQFLKQRKSKTRPTTPKPDTPSSYLDNEKTREHVLTPEISPVLISPTPCVTTNLDLQSSHTLLPPKVKSTTDEYQSTTFSSSSAATSPVPAETQLSVQVSSSPVCSDPLNFTNTTSLSKPDSDLTPDSISSVHCNAEAVSEPDLDNIPGPQPDISSLLTCDTVLDSCLSTTPEVTTDNITQIVPSDTTYVFDAPSSKGNDVIPNQELTSMPDVAKSESISNLLLDDSKDSCPEFFSEGISPHALFTPEESLSLPIDDPSSPAFSLPSPAPSSPDPFPPGLFCERPLPPRKTLDPFPERLLDCRASSSPDLFPLGLFNARPVPPKMIYGFFQNETVTSQESLSPNARDEPEHPSETADFNRPDLPDLSEANQHGSTLKKSKAKQKKIGKLKFSEDDEASEGLVPVPMQPSLEDVEGQLFVSFMSKKALEIHLGDDAEMETPQKPIDVPDVDEDNIQAKIKVLEKALLRDLKVMRNRQVIHPVLQEVGLKLNLLDLTLEIDLQYLGVQLPIPPPVLAPEGSPVSSQVPFVSRTGKTTDVTQIKGWREKFVGPGSLSEGVPNADSGQKNLSAFCSDMLDEYLASEGKLIDERAANLSQTDTTPVAYQLPTKSTSYVRTLDSVLKKQIPATSPAVTPKVKPTFKPKEKKTFKKSLKSGKGMKAKPALSVDKPVLFSKKPQQIKKCKNIKKPKIFSPEKPTFEPNAILAFNETPVVEATDTTALSTTGGRASGLPKTLVKLLDVEDGAVWEGKHRTCITKERAAIALATLVTVEGASKATPDAIRIIRRRAPPCLNVFCRLGCVCASLVHMRRHHHCGKPQCMLGCSCLRRKVVALKTPKEEEGTADDPELQGLSEDDRTKWRKKSKKRKAYVLTDPETAPEPAKRVNTLWDRKRHDYSEAIFSPLRSTPFQSLLPQEIQREMESSFSTLKQKRVEERNLHMTEENVKSKRTCARCRVFYSKRRHKQKLDDQHHVSQVSSQEIEEGELVPLNSSGPAKRLEIISECTWDNTEIRNNIMQIVCEHMAQDRLKHPFWIGKYFIQPISKTETEDGSVETHKVNISQPVEKKTENKNVLEDEDELVEDHEEESEVKGLPFISKVCPAGLLKAKKKAPDSPGRIMVNGKPYPQAKLELGQMGALHPANRLAAYITGRICPTTTTITKAPVASVPASTVATEAKVISTPASATTSSVEPVVIKSPVGKVFTQFVVNHIGSQNLPNTSTLNPQPSIPKIVIPSSMLMVGKEAGVTLSPLNPAVVAQVSESSDSTGSATFPTVSNVQAPAVTILNKSPSLPLGGSGATSTATVSSSGLTSPGKKIFLTVMSRKPGPPNSAPLITKPVTQTRPPQTSTQKMLLQVVKTADGNTLYRNANGQLMQLVPLSQIKALKPSLLSQGSQPTYIRLQAPVSTGLKKPQGGSASIVKSFIPTTQTPTKPIVTFPASTSSLVSGKPVSLTTSKSVSLSSLPSTIKVVPGLLGQPGTCTLRILPPNSVKGTESITLSSSPVLSQSGFTLIKPTSPTLLNQDSTKSVTAGSVSSLSTEMPVVPVHNQSETNSAKQNSCDASEPIEDNTSELPFSASTTSQSRQFSEDGSSSAEVGNRDDTSVDENDFDKAQDSEVEVVDSDVTELTDDSDLYSDDDQQDAFSLSGSDKVKKVKDTEGLQSENKDYAEVVVDIETIEESEEKNCVARFRASALRRMHHQSNRRIKEEKIQIVKRVLHNKLERKRRQDLVGGFLKLQTELGKHSRKLEFSKVDILTKAHKAIENLVEQESLLIKKTEKLRLQREHYIQSLSMLCDKSTESISQKLNEIIAKQKSLLLQTKTKKVKPQHNQATPTSKSKSNLVDRIGKQMDLAFQNKSKDAPNPTYSPSKPIDLSIKKQKSLEKTESVSKSTSSKPQDLNSSKNTSETQVNNTSSTSKPSQPSFNSSPQKRLVSVPSPIKLSSVTRERTRPNILSRSSCQMIQGSPVKEPLLTKVCIPQVFPLINTMVPCNQIIAINNSLQQIGITSVGSQQASTPGVASVSLVPTISHPRGIENSLPVLQPQFIKITNNPVNLSTQVGSANLSNITNVISLVPPVENLVIPQKAVEDASVIQSQPIAEANLHTVSDVNISEVEEMVDEFQPKDILKPSVGGEKNSASVVSPNQEEVEKKSPDDSNDPEDENLMSLLDELVLLSQQLNNEDEEQRIVVPGEEQECSKKQADTDQDDERPLSPLFLTLDEDLMSPDPKDEIDIPPKVDDLVKVIFGSDSPSVSSDTGVASSTNAASPHGPTCNVKVDAPTPPPLLHMKPTCEAASGQSATEGTNVAWRPMPKLVPLGLKTQDAVVNKVTGSSVPSPDSIEQEVHRPQM